MSMVETNGTGNQAVHALGTLLQRGDGAATENFVAVGQITDLSGPGFEMDTIEVTNHLTTQGYKEYIHGLRDTGEITATVHIIPGDAMGQTVMDDYNSNTVSNWRVLLPGGEWAIAGRGFVSGLDHSFPLDDAATYDLTVQCSGKWEYVEVGAT